MIRLASHLKLSGTGHLATTPEQVPFDVWEERVRRNQIHPLTKEFFLDLWPILQALIMSRDRATVQIQISDYSSRLPVKVFTSRIVNCLYPRLVVLQH